MTVVKDAGGGGIDYGTIADVYDRFVTYAEDISGSRKPSRAAAGW